MKEIEPEKSSVQFIRELHEILNEQTTTDTDKSADVCSLVEDWHKEISRECGFTFDFSTKDAQRAVIDEKKEEDRKVIPHNPHLFAEAQQRYFDEHSLTREEFVDLDFSDQVTHREGITALYRDMLTQTTREQAVAKLGNGPFLKTDVAEQDEDDEALVAPEARTTWYLEQVQNLENDISIVDAELGSIVKQEQNVQLNSMLKQVNVARVKELEFEKRGLVTKLGHYKSKLSV